MLKQIAEYPGMVKDTGSGAILNNDNSGLEAYRKTRQRMNRLSSVDGRTSIIESEIQTLKTDINDIKSMLKLLLERK